MGWFGDGHDNAQAYDKYQDAPKNKSHISHELISSAAAFEAAKEYEKHKEKNGQPVSHAKAKEIAAGFAGAFIDKQFETHGVDLIWCRLTKQLDFLDKEKAKHQAKQHVEQAVDQNGY
ncbi:CipC1 protein [Russula emetica]|nr:CipC1 protein [Russula emetica]